MLLYHFIDHACICILCICITITSFPNECLSFTNTPNTRFNTKPYIRIATTPTFAYLDSGDCDNSNKKLRQKDSNTRVVTSKNKNRNTKYARKNTSPQPPLSSIFTHYTIAPPLEQLQISNPQKDNTIVTSSVIQNIQQECITNICGDLPITYTNDPKTLEQWLNEHCFPQEDSIYSFLGFDVESAPTLPWRKPINADFANRPATIQLSTPHSSIVVHLTNASKDIPHDTSILSLLTIMLTDETILKIGVGIDEDMLELYRWNRCLDAKSRFDIGGIGSSYRNQAGLKKLVKSILGVELLKSKEVAMSDWSHIPLTNKQICYASRDAWAGAAVMESIPKICNADTMNINSIASLVSKRERTMADVHARAKIRKDSKKQIKRMKDQEDPLLQSLPQGTVKKEMKRLKRIVDETAPDGLIIFDANPLGLDFR